MPKLDLVLNNTPIRDEADFLCLTDIHKAAGSPKNKDPSQWLRSKQAREFCEFLAEMSAMGNSHSALVRTESGGTGGSGATLAHWQLALAYAKYLSPAFHEQCNTIVRDYMMGLTRLADSDQILLAVLKSQQDQLVLLTELVQHARIGSQRPEGPSLGSPPPTVFITEPQRRELMGLARLVETPIEPVWARIRSRFRFPRSVRVFETVFAQQFEAVRDHLIASRPEMAPDNVENLGVGPEPVKELREADTQRDMTVHTVAQRLKKDADVDVTAESLSCTGGVYQFLNIPPLYDHKSEAATTVQSAAYLDESRYLHVLHGFKTQRAALLHIADTALRAHNNHLEALRARSRGRH